jgi:hypothetical protein
MKNEREMLPHFLRHYGPEVDEIHLVDNGSTDGSDDIARERPNVFVHPEGDREVVDEDLYVCIKQDMWRTWCQDVDWVIGVDIDELLWFGCGLRKFIEGADQGGCTCLDVLGWNMIGNGFDDKSPITEQIKHGVRTDKYGLINNEKFAGFYNKMAVWKPKLMRPCFGHGCHTSEPTGTVKISRVPVYLLHYKFASLDRALGVHRNRKLGIKDFTDEQTRAYYSWADKNKVQVIP